MKGECDDRVIDDTPDLIGDFERGQLAEGERPIGMTVGIAHDDAEDPQRAVRRRRLVRLRRACVMLVNGAQIMLDRFLRIAKTLDHAVVDP